MNKKRRKPKKFPEVLKEPIINCLTFSFAHITTNNKFCFKTFKNHRDELIAYRYLFEILEELSQKTWVELLSKNKFLGIETIPYGEIHFKASNEDNLVKNDTKIQIMRFGPNKKYRLLGFKLDNDPTFFIIGYDFNFNAYNHG